MERDPPSVFPDPSAQPQFVRLTGRARPPLTFTLDGVATPAHEGDTILAAVLTLRRCLSDTLLDGERVIPPRVPLRCGAAPDGRGIRASGRPGGAHAGFCLMGACQECWVTADGRAVRACGTLVRAGMRVTTLRHDAGG